MGDLKDPRLMYLKAGLFLLIGLLSGGLLVLANPSLRTLFLLLSCVWSFCRLYYFTFYVIEKYIDGNYRFSGLWSFFEHLVRHGLPREGSRGPE